MTTTAADDHNDVAQTEPPAKRRRGGRRSTNPEISAEERKRLRVLKNRESAMRSLAKKAEYSAKLENLEKETVADYKSIRENLEKCLSTAIGLRTALDKVPEDLPNLITKAEACINQATTALAAEEAAQPNFTQQGTPETSSEPVMNGEETNSAK